MNKLLKETKILVGIGGSFTTSAKILLEQKDFSEQAIQKASFSSKEFFTLEENILKMPIKSLQKNFRLHRKRADLMHAGIGIINSFIRLINPDKIFISTEGVGKGAVMQYLM